MDIFWIFILIFGIIVSIGQKASKQQAPQEAEGDVTLSPEEEMERRIRELLEGKQTPQQAPQPAPPVAKPAAPQKSFTPAPTTTPQRAVSPQRVAAAQRVATPARSATTPARTTQSTPKAPTRTNKASDPIKQGEIKQSEIGRIIDDFTIDKATIYAEIMTPKYKEY